MTKKTDDGIEVTARMGMPQLDVDLLGLGCSLTVNVWNC
jgi:hypothetical protein